MSRQHMVKKNLATFLGQVLRDRNTVFFGNKSVCVGSLQITAAFPLISEELPLFLPISLMIQACTFKPMLPVPRVGSALFSGGCNHREGASPC